MLLLIRLKFIQLFVYKTEISSVNFVSTKNTIISVGIEKFIFCDFKHPIALIWLRAPAGKRLQIICLGNDVFFLWATIFDVVFTEVVFFLTFLTFEHQVSLQNQLFEIAK